MTSVGEEILTARECGCVWRNPIRDCASICSGCETRLRRELSSVPDLVEDLHVTLTRTDRLTVRQGGRGAETPVPWKDPASAALADLHAYLTSWVRCIAEDIGTPADHVRDTSPACAAWLLVHLRIVRLHPAAPDLLDELATATDRGRRAIDLPSDSSRFHVGPCPETYGGEHCTGEVWANIPVTTDRPALLRCRGCSASWDTTQWNAAGRDILRRREQLATG